MVQLQESGRYDDAIRVVEEWMNQHPNDTSQNDFLHLQIAIVYISKAYHQQQIRNQSVQDAASHVEQALNLYAAKKREDMDSFVSGIGRAYEILEDLSEKDECQFYANARKAFEAQLPLIKGDSYTEDGRTVALEPLRADVRKHLTSLEEKSARASCAARLRVLRLSGISRRVLINRITSKVDFGAEHFTGSVTYQAQPQGQLLAPPY